MPHPSAPTPGTFFPDLAGMFKPPEKHHGKTKKDEPTWKAGARALRREREKGERNLRAKGQKGNRRKG
jgi:hypothetical protein